MKTTVIRTLDEGNYHITHNYTFVWKWHLRLNYHYSSNLFAGVDTSCQEVKK